MFSHVKKKPKRIAWSVSNERLVTDRFCFHNLGDFQTRFCGILSLCSINFYWLWESAFIMINHLAVIYNSLLHSVCESVCMTFIFWLYSSAFARMVTLYESAHSVNSFSHSTGVSSSSNRRDTVSQSLFSIHMSSATISSIFFGDGGICFCGSFEWNRIVSLFWESRPQGLGGEGESEPQVNPKWPKQLFGHTEPRSPPNIYKYFPIVTQ